MVFSVIKKIILFIPNKLNKINDFSEKALNLPDSVNKTYIYVTKITGVSAGSLGASKGSADLMEAIVCKDGVCAFVSAVGLCADCLCITTSFIPGPNVTSFITVPVSLFCKGFVHFCKASKLPWGGC